MKTHDRIYPKFTPVPGAFLVAEKNLFGGFVRFSTLAHDKYMSLSVLSEGSILRQATPTGRESEKRFERSVRFLNWLSIKLYSPLRRYP